MRRRPFRTDDRGAALVEFAFVAPVMCLFLVGGFDIAHTLYLQAALQGVVQKTARDSALEDGASDAAQQLLDDKVRAQVAAVVNNATVTFTRRFYRTFATAAAAKAEDWTDTNGNKTCDANEPYTDSNNNSVWDKDGGDSGQGGAKDKTVYSVKVEYPRMFPLDKFIPSLPANQSFTVKTVLQNQPYTDQGSYTTTNTVRNCP